jgi:hypothetical protein
MAFLKAVSKLLQLKVGFDFRVLNELAHERLILNLLGLQLLILLFEALQLLQ